MERTVPMQLNGGLLRDLIVAVGGMDAFLDRWHMSSANGLDHLNKATIHRWINGQLPKNSEKLLRLSAVLDVDPFALLATGEGTVTDAVDEVLQIVQARRSVPPALLFLRPFFGRQEQWPPEIPSFDHRQRQWYVRQFEHDFSLRCNFYQSVELRNQGPSGLTCPQVFHFAFRHPRMFAARWLQYGLVLRSGLRSALWHINGHTEELTLPTLNEPTHVRTWFGPGPAIFRVASLHSFTLAIAGQREHQRPALAFPG